MPGECAIEDEVVVIKQFHDVVNGQIVSLMIRDDRVTFKTVFSDVERQSCRDKCKK